MTSDGGVDMLFEFQMSSVAIKPSISVKSCIALAQSVVIGALADAKPSAAGVSPSGKAPAFDAGIRRFESCHPSHFPLRSANIHYCKWL